MSNNLQSRQQQLAGRFGATIPLKKPLVVSYTDVMGLGSKHQAIGLPNAVRRDVIYVLVKPQVLVGIPIACLLDIQPLY